MKLDINKLKQKISIALIVLTCGACTNDLNIDIPLVSDYIKDVTIEGATTEIDHDAKTITILFESVMDLSRVPTTFTLAHNTVLINYEDNTPLIDLTDLKNGLKVDLLYGNKSVSYQMTATFDASLAIIGYETLPGKNRAEIKLNLGNNADLSKLLLKWNDDANSKEVIVDNTAIANKSISILLDEALKEGNNFIKLESFDKANKPTSNIINITARTYGENYSNALLNRKRSAVSVLSLSPSNTGKIKFEFEASAADMLAVKFEYTGKTGASMETVLEKNAGEIILVDCDFDQEIMYSTTYKPEPKSLDLFQSAAVKYLVSDEDLMFKLDKQHFASAMLNNDTPNDYESDPSLKIANLWDGLACDNIVTWAEQVNYMNWTSGIGTGQASITIKVAEERVRLSHIKINLYWPYTWTGIKKYELWAYTKGDNVPPMDGNWDDWTKLGTIDNSPATVSEEAKAAAYTLGDNLYIDVNDAPLARYIRFKFLEDYRGVNDGKVRASFSEVTCWAYLDIEVEN